MHVWPQEPTRFMDNYPQAPKDQEVVHVEGAMEGKGFEPVATKIAAVGQQRVQTIYSHTTLTHNTRRTHNYPIGSGCEKSDLSAAYLNALFTGTDATDLSDSEAAELNDIYSYRSTAMQMGACKKKDIWRMI